MLKDLHVMSSQMFGLLSAHSWLLWWSVKQIIFQLNKGLVSKQSWFARNIVQCLPWKTIAEPVVISNSTAKINVLDFFIEEKTLNFPPSFYFYTAHFNSSQFRIQSYCLSGGFYTAQHWIFQYTHYAGCAGPRSWKGPHLCQNSVSWGLSIIQLLRQQLSLCVSLN